MRTPRQHNSMYIPCDSFLKMPLLNFLSAQDVKESSTHTRMYLVILLLEGGGLIGSSPKYPSDVQMTQTPTAGPPHLSKPTPYYSSISRYMAH